MWQSTRNWKEQFEFYMEAIEVKEDADKRKIAHLITVAGTEALEVYRNFV
jgi:hypothetical protein